MSRGKQNEARSLRDICVGEDFRLAATMTIEKFRTDEEQNELEFPSSLTSSERAYIHRLCLMMGLASKSRGQGLNRFITLSRKDGSNILQSPASFQLVKNSRQQIQTLLQRFGLTNKERQELLPRTERAGLFNPVDVYGRDVTKTTGRLNNGIPQIPLPRAPAEFDAFRSSLPVASMHPLIMQMIKEKQVVMITGETGSGKTTQVPQFVLDDACECKYPARIICTQPRRIAALTVAERVAQERGEKVGQTIGYQIRLESRVSPRTLLTFCTSGVLLRTLMAGDSAMPIATITHVIVDEVHERDRFTDFLLISLRQLLSRHRNLKLILMSAALDTELFQKYFGGCPIIKVSGRLFNVQTNYLEDAIKFTGHITANMLKFMTDKTKVEKQQKQLTDWCSMLSVRPHETGAGEPKPIQHKFPSTLTKIADKAELIADREELEPLLLQEMDMAVAEAWLKGDDDSFTHLLHLIMSENVSVDYQHSDTSATPLMIAAGRGHVDAVEQLLSLGANASVRASNSWTAIDWARRFQHQPIVELLESHVAIFESGVTESSSSRTGQLRELSFEDRELLNAYHYSFDDDKVDLDLILALLLKIHTTQEPGAILVFLPGYDEIITLRERILNEDARFTGCSKFILYTLHSAMQSSDQKRVFKNPPPNTRKIILSTNIAETSITINDIVYVIDSGKVKEKSYDALTHMSMLKSVWIAKSSALQRRGRAGRCRPGVCYHLFSRSRHDTLSQFQQAELLRTPLHELCLHSKLLAPHNTSIADFLSKAPEAPAFMVTRQAVQLLKTIDALDNWEDLTELGHHLVDLPVEPRLGKMVLHSVVLKCLDPILTIVCTLAYRDPFMLPYVPSQKRAALMVRKKFAAGTFSDHMALLRAFQAWQKARGDGWEKTFCERNFLSSATMEVILGMRTQLLGQLRASGFVRARGPGDIRDLNSNSENWAVVKAVICAGTYPYLCRVDRQKRRLFTQKENKVRLHPSSVLGARTANASVTVAAAHAQVLQALPTGWLAYEEATRVHHVAYVRCVTLLTPITLALFAGPARMPLESINEAENRSSDASAEVSSDSEGEEREADAASKATLKIDSWLSFRMDQEAISLVLQLRQKWHCLFLRRMRNPSKPWSQADETVMQTIINILTNEEIEAGLQQPPGIGQRPRPMSSDYVTTGHGSQQRSSEDEVGGQSPQAKCLLPGQRRNPSHSSPLQRAGRF